MTNFFDSDYIYAKLISYVQNMDRPGLQDYIKEIVRSSIDYALLPLIYTFTGTILIRYGIVLMI